MFPTLLGHWIFATIVSLSLVRSHVIILSCSLLAFGVWVDLEYRICKTFLLLIIIIWCWTNFVLCRWIYIARLIVAGFGVDDFFFFLLFLSNGRHSSEIIIGNGLKFVVIKILICTWLSFITFVHGYGNIWEILSFILIF